MIPLRWMLGVAVIGLSHAADPPPLLTPATTIALPGVEGRFDHASYDAATHRLFLAALGNNSLEVARIDTGRRVHTIAELRKPTGVLFLSDSNRIVVACGDDGTCRFFDGTSYAEVGRVTGLDDADNLRFDSAAKRIYIGFGDGALGAIDPATMKLTGRIPLPKHPESFQIETKGVRIFVNVPGAREIAVVNRAEAKIATTWPLKNASANFPMALDETNHRLMIGCREPARLIVIDTESGKTVAEAPMHGDVDDLFYHPLTGRLFASCGEGFVDVFHRVPGGELKEEAHFPTNSGARTCFSSASEGWLCVAVPHRDRQLAELRLFRTADR